MKQNRKDYVKFLQRASGKNPFLSSYLAERAYLNQLSASIFAARFQGYMLKGGK